MPRKRKRRKEFEPFPEEMERAVEADLVRPLEEKLPKGVREKVDKRVVTPLRKRHLLAIAFIIIAAAIFSFAIIGFDVVTPGTMNPFIPPEEPVLEPEEEALPVPEPVPEPVAEPEPEPVTVFPGCEQGYAEITANEVTKIGACFRSRAQYHACIEWGLRNARANEVPSYELTLSYYSAAQRCALDIGDKELTADIETYLIVYDECWRLPNDSNYHLMAECFESYKRGMGALWVDPAGFDTIAGEHAAEAAQEIAAYNALMAAQ